MSHFLPFRIAVVILVLAWAGAILGTDRSLILMSRPMIDHIGEAKIPDEVGNMTQLLDDYGVHTPRPHVRFEAMLRLANTLLGHPPRPANYDDLSSMSKPMIGNAVREWSFLGLALGWQNDPEPSYEGGVVYVQNNWQMIHTGLRPEGWEVIDKANGRDVSKATIYPFWNHTWGWLYLLGMILTWWLWTRGQAARREELGLID